MLVWSHMLSLVIFIPKDKKQTLFTSRNMILIIVLNVFARNLKYYIEMHDEFYILHFTELIYAKMKPVINCDLCNFTSNQGKYSTNIATNKAQNYHKTPNQINLNF